MEEAIEKNLKSFYEVGSALIKIRNKKLYLHKNGGEYQTFEDYCHSVWDLTARHAERLIGSVGVIEKTRPVGRIPANLEQTRPLFALRDNPEKMCIAWAKAVETAPGGKVTAAHVARVFLP